MLDPSSNQVTPMADPRIGRDYHTEALLLPDGRVLVAGSDPLFDDEKNTIPGTFEQRIEITGDLNPDNRTLDHTTGNYANFYTGVMQPARFNTAAGAGAAKLLGTSVKPSFFATSMFRLIWVHAAPYRIALTSGKPYVRFIHQK